MEEALLTPNGAASIISQSKKCAESHARQALIAALMLEDFCGYCGEYRRTAWATHSDQSKIEFVNGESPVPSDFWRLEHAHDFSRGNGRYILDTGAAGYWDRATFTTGTSLSAWVFFDRYPDFQGVAASGTELVELRIDVRGVWFHAIDIERLCERRLSPLIRAASRRISIPQRK